MWVSGEGDYVCVGGRGAMYVDHNQVNYNMDRAGRRGGKLYIAVPLTKEVCCDVVTDDHGDGEEAPEETLKNVLSDKVSLRAQHEEGQVRPAKLGEREGGEGREARRGGERRGGNEGGEEKREADKSWRVGRETIDNEHTHRFIFKEEVEGWKAEGTSEGIYCTVPHHSKLCLVVVLLQCQHKHHKT